MSEEAKDDVTSSMPAEDHPMAEGCSKKRKNWEDDFPIGSFDLDSPPGIPSGDCFW